MELIYLMMRIVQVVILTVLLFFLILFCMVELTNAYHCYKRLKRENEQ